MIGKTTTACAWSLVFLIALVLPAAGEERAEFPLEEYCPFGTNKFLRGQVAHCAKEPDADVMKYPAFVSTAPLYGKVAFGGKWDDAKAGVTHHFAIDESGGAGKGYDTFYFDLNRNLDLTDDPVVAPMKKEPAGAKFNWHQAKGTVFFDYINVPFDYGAPIGVRDFPVMPRFTFFEKDSQGLVSFVSPVARRGKIVIGGREADIALGQENVITGRFDKLGITTQLAGEGWWWGVDTLRAMRFVDGKWYRLSTTPLGDKLFVEPYTGDMGLLTAGAGGREVKELGMSGSLESSDSCLQVGPVKEGEMESPQSVSEWALPAGDYRPTLISVTVGRLSVQISYNYHSDGKPRERLGRAPVYGIKIRKDKPFAFDFSNPPDVMFASPAKSQTFKPGDTVAVSGILVDPIQDFMIRGLVDTGRKEQKEYKDDSGRTSSYEESVSLDAKVTIRDSAGNAVAEGKMPFG